ncbi:MAG: nitrophenyl compound nitroreductase subunit ArsF family protein [Patescibacteria group bacterium]|jgi:hypothetical protein
MKKKILLFSLIIIAPLLLAGCEGENKTYYFDKDGNMTTEKSAETEVVPAREIPADKVQVFLFHAAQRCATCIAIGKLAGETVNERFRDELKAGKIEFKEINIDLPENKELALKFQASGSALFLNSNYNGEDHIVQNTKVWQLTGNPTAFKDYLEGRINALLGK